MRAIMPARRCRTGQSGDVADRRPAPRPSIGDDTRRRGMLRKVDLPAPFEPITVTNWPRPQPQTSMPRSAEHGERRAGVEGDRPSARPTDHGAARAARRRQRPRRPGANKCERPPAATVTTLTSDAVKPEIPPVIEREPRWRAGTGSSRARRRASPTGTSRDGMIAVPPMTAASATTMTPMPIDTSAAPSIWANRAPLTAGQAICDERPAGHAVPAPRWPAPSADWRPPPASPAP